MGFPQPSSGPVPPKASSRAERHGARFDRVLQYAQRVDRGPANLDDLHPAPRLALGPIADAPRPPLHRAGRHIELWRGRHRSKKPKGTRSLRQQYAATAPPHLHLAAHPLRSSAAVQGCVCGLSGTIFGSFGCPPHDRGVGGRKTRAGEHHLPTGHVVGAALPFLANATPTRDWRPRNPLFREALLPPKRAG